jgi:hypothetical protein
MCVLEVHHARYAPGFLVEEHVSVPQIRVHDGRVVEKHLLVPYQVVPPALDHCDLSRREEL